MNYESKSRLKSLLWRAGMMALVVVLDVVAQGLTELSLPVGVVIVAGLILGEVSKFLNNKYGLKRNEDI